MAAEEQLAANLAEWKAKVKDSGQRSWPEWIGKDADAPIPEKVQLRVRKLWDEQCYLSGIKFGPLRCQMEHKLALQFCIGVNGNRESNLRPVLEAAHKKKTAKEKTSKSKADRAARAHAGLKESEHTIPQRPKPEKSTSRLDSIRALGGSEISRRYR